MGVRKRGVPPPRRGFLVGPLGLVTHLGQGSLVPQFGGVNFLVDGLLFTGIGLGNTNWGQRKGRIGFFRKEFFLLKRELFDLFLQWGQLILFPEFKV